MTSRDFLNIFIQEMPSRGLDDVGVYICMKLNEYECQSFKIKEISNDGDNDSITIYISKVD